MSVFRRLWGNADRESQGKPTSPVVDECKDYQPFNPYTELLFLEHHQDIVRVLVKIDSKRCVSAGDDNLAIIWDIQFGYRHATLTGHSRPITAILCVQSRASIPEQLVTGSSDKQIRIWNIASGDCIKVLSQNLSSVKCLLQYGNGGQFISGGEDLCLWSNLGQQLAMVKHGEESDISFMITLKNNRVVTAVDKHLTVYTVGDTDTTTAERKTQTIALVKKLTPHREPVRSLINISEDTFASGSIDGTITLWKTDSLLAFRYFNSVDAYEGCQKTFPFSVEQMICMENRYVIAAIGSGFAIYDMETGQTLMEKHNAHYSKINSLTFTCSGLYLATAAVDGSIRLWSFVDVLRDSIQNDNIGGKSDINTMSENGILQIWWRKDRHQNKMSLVGECLAHAGSVQVVIDCDGESLVSCGIDYNVIVWKNENIQMMKRSLFLQSLTQISGDGIV